MEVSFEPKFFCFQSLAESTLLKLPSKEIQSDIIVANLRWFCLMLSLCSHQARGQHKLRGKPFSAFEIPSFSTLKSTNFTNLQHQAKPYKWVTKRKTRHGLFVQEVCNDLQRQERKKLEEYNKTLTHTGLEVPRRKHQWALGYQESLHTERRIWMNSTGWMNPGGFQSVTDQLYLGMWYVHIKIIR